MGKEATVEAGPVLPAPSDITTVPAGYEIGFWQEDKDAKPKVKRHYRIRSAEPTDPWDNVPEAVSVTTALKVLDKPALPWWGQGIGIVGTTKLVNMGLLKVLMDTSGPVAQPVLCYEGEMGAWHAAGQEKIEELLTNLKLTTNHVRDEGGRKGQSAHDALEVWATEGILPDPAIYPSHEQGYVMGLLQFLEDAALVVEGSEVIVGSLAYHFAGRYDLRARVTEERRIVKHHTPVKGNQYAVMKPGLGLWDLKTSKDVYAEHCVQLEAYEGASLECGYDPTDFRAVVHVDANGHYKVVRSWATYEDFLTVLATYHAFEAMNERRKEMKK